ncbi:AraC family transcriptional regulator [Persicobacter diffluens]|uniref:HTH araC/xylS-type domain-containing protein n=1 Tax=Persicobacter diffluens TaxID=981 RepID=A0AAN4W2M4_9BACT|nr:hypothetical protein PEDI_51030 [Persicobacter diffluens]
MPVTFPKDPNDPIIVEFNEISSADNNQQLAEEIGGSWDGHHLQVKNEYFDLDVRHFFFLEQLTVEICELHLHKNTHFIQNLEKNRDHICIRVGFSGLIINLSEEKSFQSNGIFVYNTNQDFNVEFPAGATIRWVGLKFPKELISRIFTHEKPHKLKALAEETTPWVHYFSLDAEMEEYIKAIFEQGRSSNGREATPLSRSIDIIGAVKEKLEMDDPMQVHERIHPEDLQKIITIKDQMLSNLDQIPRLEDYSSEHGMSITKMNNLFKRVFKLPFLKFYNTQKTEEVRRKIQHTNLSLTEIADELGFSHVGHMSRVFKKQYGFPPSALRRISAV